MPTAGPPLPELAGLPDYRRLRGDPARWLPAMQEVCRRHGLDERDLYAERSGTNLLARAGHGPWIKLFPPLWGADALREQAALEALAGTSDLPVPRLLASGTLAGWPYLVLTHLPGEPLARLWPQVAPDAQADLARQAGVLLRRLHDLDLPAGGPLLEDWPAFVAAQRGCAVERNAAHGLPPGWAAEFAEYVAGLPDLAPPGTRLVFLHADVTDEHLLATRGPAGWRLTGLIDFADAMVGDALYEFAAPLVFLGQRRPHVRRALFEGYGWAGGEPGADTVRRMAAWCLLHQWGRVQHYVTLTPPPLPVHLADLLTALGAPPPSGG